MKTSTEKVSWSLACSIMERNYIAISELVQRLEINSSDSDLDELMTIPFSEETLERSRKEYALIPFLPLSIKDMIKKYPSFFWYCDEELILTFGKSLYHSKVKTGWRLIRIGYVPDSKSKVFDDQFELLAPRESIPDVKTLVYANLVFLLLRRKELIPKEDFLRTSSFTYRNGGKGSRISISSVGLEGIQFITFGDDTSQYDLGLASEIKSRKK